ncbi:MAG: polysaccharide deacetylase family protein [Bacteroidales bacterium]|nr:polysaccharide deacetylase family protein [Bacteroidales bacterium]
MIYYLLAGVVIRRNTIRLPSSMDKKRNIFIYFDYEREFGGHDTSISDRDISVILDLLEKYHIRTTWFTVGKIFDKYPASVSMILAHGHEIGSHTWAHVPPLWTSRGVLEKDFFRFDELSGPLTEVKGFHPPNGKWSIITGMLLEKHGYFYDVVKADKVKVSADEYYTCLFTKKKIIRLYTKGDDWPLFNRNISAQSACEHFDNILNKTGIGELGGIGFHPWVLMSDSNILEGFEMFISRLAVEENTNVNTVLHYVSILRQRSTN